MAGGFEEACIRCLADHTAVIYKAVTEQLYSGLDGEGNLLSPTYDEDPFFDEPGFWYNRAGDYKAWKRTITPPAGGSMIGLPPRPDNVPNLFIDGKFYSEISVTRSGDVIIVDPGMDHGPDIVAKYGEKILCLGNAAVEYFNITYMWPAIETFFRDCGYE